MTTQRCLFAAAVISVSVAPASGQTPTYPLKKCDSPKEQVGILPRITGQLFYLLGKDGKPDTVSIKVLRASGISAAGFRSVGARQLSACRFDVEKAGLAAPVGVMSEVMADSASFTLGSATQWITPAAPLAIEPPGLPKDSFPMPASDRRIEERPRQLSCKGPTNLPRTTTTTTTTGTAAAQAAAKAQAAATSQVDMNNWNTMNTGQLTAEVRVGTDGKPGTQVRVIDVSNPVATTSLANLIGTCEFVPGRYRGVKVPAFGMAKIVVMPQRVQ